jgi:hypothetical protein
MIFLKLFLSYNACVYIKNLRREANGNQYAIAAVYREAIVQVITINICAERNE